MLISDDVHGIIQLLIFLFIGVEFGLYVLIRQLVNTKEWLSACRDSAIPNMEPANSVCNRARS